MPVLYSIAENEGLPVSGSRVSRANIPVVVSASMRQTTPKKLFLNAVFNVYLSIVWPQNYNVLKDMHKKKRGKNSWLKFTLIFGWILSVFVAEAQHVYQFDLEGDIGPGSWRMVKNAYLKAEGADVDLVLIKMNTFGGMVNFADSIRSRILDSPLETVVFIHHNAASAGALISLACDRIYMSKGSSIGAASVVDQSGQVLPEKHQSYMRGLMRATAEAKGRDPKIAEAFVDGDIDLPAIKPAGKILTLTSSEAVKIGLAEAEVASTADLLKAEEIRDPQTTVHQVTVIDRIISFLISPAVSGIQILLIIGGIYFEMQTPGIGFALVVAIIAATLFFAPLYIQGLADNWEIALFVAGIVLILLELFVIP